VPKLHKLPPNPEAEKVAATRFILKHKPPVTDVICDPYNGRYRVVAPHGADWKSVSWSKRGISPCIFIVLHTAWSFEMQYLGASPPFSLAELLAGLDEDALVD
jgi:hypothetical protein